MKNSLIFNFVVRTFFTRRKKKSILKTRGLNAVHHPVYPSSGGFGYSGQNMGVKVRTDWHLMQSDLEGVPVGYITDKEKLSH